jgi:hypothetical protein
MLTKRDLTLADLETPVGTVTPGVTSANLAALGDLPLGQFGEILKFAETFETRLKSIVTTLQSLSGVVRETQASPPPAAPAPQLPVVRSDPEQPKPEPETVEVEVKVYPNPRKVYNMLLDSLQLLPGSMTVDTARQMARDHADTIINQIQLSLVETYD